MPPISSRAYFNPLNKTNGAYNENFFELLVKIVNYSALKGLQSRFSPATMYIVWTERCPVCSNSTTSSCKDAAAAA